MHTTGGEAVSTARQIKMKAAALQHTEVLLCPPFTALASVAEVIDGGSVQLGAQNMHWEEQGAFTGEIAPGMLTAAGAAWVLIGHSERRSLFGETGETVNLKLKAALHYNLRPILCVGETLEQREADAVQTVLTQQLREALLGITAEDMARLTIAYEPVWAIGTGVVATTEQADAAHQLIRDWLDESYSAEIAGMMRILYGGSVKPDNAGDLFRCENINGALVGGASLKAEDFAAIFNAAEELS